MPDVRLDTFEVDESNKFAVALCKAFINLEKGYSPLLIHGEHGSGKTHLLTAVTTEISLSHPEVSLLFITDEVPPENLFGSHDGSNGGSEIRDLGRKDFLVVDDLERFAANAAARDNFSAFFNTFVDSGKQILVATALPLNQIRGFDKRLLSRLSGGIDAHLSPPQPETRLKILKRECARLGLELDSDILQLLMREAGKNAHYLKAIPGYLKTFAALNRETLTKEKVGEILDIVRERLGEKKGHATTEEIVASLVQIQTKKREDDLQATLQKYQQELSQQKERADQLEHELEKLASGEQGASAEAASIKAKKGKPELERLSAKELREHEEQTTKLKANYEKLLAEKDAAIAELEGSLSKKLSPSSQYSEQQKRAERKIESLQSQLAQVNKEKADQLLALKIQLEDKEEKLALLREERGKRSIQQQKEQSDFQGRYEESASQNILLKRAVDELNGKVKEQEKELNRLKQVQADIDQKRTLVEAALKEKEKFISENITGWKSESEKTKTLEGELANLSTREQELTKKIATLSSSLETERARSEKYQQDYDALSERAKKAESELGSTQTQIKIITDREQGLRQETDRLRADREKLKKNISGLTSDLLTSKSTIEQHSKTLSEKIAEVDRLITTNHELRNQVSEHEQVLLAKEREEAERVRRFHEELKERDEEILAAEARLKAHETFRRTAEEENEKLTGQVQKLAEQFANVTKEKEKTDQAYTNWLEEARAEIEAREKKLAELRAGMEAANARADETTRRLDEAQKEWQHQLEQGNTERSEREKALEKENAMLQRENQEAAANIKRLKTSVAEFEDHLRQRDQLLQSKDKGESEHIVKLKDELRRRNDEFQKLSANLAAAHEKADALEQRAAEIAKEMSDSKAEKERAEKASAAVLKESEEKLRTRQEHLAALEAKAAEAGKQVAILQDQLSERDNRISSFNKELTALKEQIFTFEKEKKSLQAEKQKASLRADQLTQEIEKSQEETEARFQEAREKLRQAQLREEELLARLESERASSTERSERQQSEAAGREKTFLEMKASLEKELKSVSDEMRKYRLNAEHAEQATEEQADLRQRAEQDALRLTEQLVEKDERIAELQHNILSLREEFSQRMVEGSEAKNAFVSMQKDLTAKERTLASIRQDYSELQQDFDKLKAEMAKTEKSIDKVRVEKEKKEQELKLRDEQLKDLRAEISQVQKQKQSVDDQSSSKVEDLERLVAEKDKKLENLESHIAQLKIDAREARQAASVKLQEEYEKQLALQRDENELLRRRIVALESAKESAPSPVSSEVVEAKEPVPLQPASALPQEFEEDEEEESSEGAAPREPVEPVNWLYSFDDFRCADANSFTVSIAQKIARNPGTLYNPLCIYGASNSGKTHLLHALGDLATTEAPGLPAKVISMPALLELIEKQDEKIRTWPVSLRLLIVDEFDISPMSPVEQTNLHKFLMQMLKKKVQIVIASQMPPIKMANLQECMLRFIEAGLLAKLEVDPKIYDEEKDAVEAIGHFARAPFVKPGSQQTVEEKKDVFDLLLQPDRNLTIANFASKEILEEYEEIFKNHKRWRKKFPLIVQEDDRQRRFHFFNALTHRLNGVFTGPVSILSLEKLFIVISRQKVFDWNGMLNRLIKSHVILVDDCDSISKFPASAVSYLRAIIEEIIGREILLMLGMSKQYKKENVFGSAYKQGTKKKI